MNRHLDLERYPLHELESGAGKTLIERCQRTFSDSGMFELPRLLPESTLRRCIADVLPLYKSASFKHEREHNIFFDDEFDSVLRGHPALSRMRTVNRTICADQVPRSLLVRIYEWPPFRQFLAAVLNKPILYPMADPLARVNVMAYYENEALNWHFDRAEFTTTVILQLPESGGDLEYAYGLRNGSEFDFDGIAALLGGGRDNVHVRKMEPGTLNVFKGRSAAHRTTPVQGDRPRIVAVFSYFAEPGVLFSEKERIEFYGRSESFLPDRFE